MIFGDVVPQGELAAASLLIVITAACSACPARIVPGIPTRRDDEQPPRPPPVSCPVGRQDRGSGRRSGRSESVRRCRRRPRRRCRRAGHLRQSEPAALPAERRRRAVLAAHRHRLPQRDPLGDHGPRWLHRGRIDRRRRCRRRPLVAKRRRAGLEPISKLPVPSRRGTGPGDQSFEKALPTDDGLLLWGWNVPPNGGGDYTVAVPIPR